MPTQINSWLRIYSLHGATHMPLEAWFAGPVNGGSSTWFDPSSGVNFTPFVQAINAAKPNILLTLTNFQTAPGLTAAMTWLIVIIVTVVINVFIWFVFRGEEW